MKTVSNPTCIDCGYSLLGATQCVCPECGRSFDPDDPASFEHGTPVSRWLLRLLRPIGWLTIALWLILFCVAWIGYSYPGQRYWIWLISLFGFFVLGMWCVLLLIIRTGLALWYRKPGPIRSREYRWLVPPITVMLLVIAVQFQLPLRSMLLISIGGLERAGGILMDPSAVATAGIGQRGGVTGMAAGIYTISSGTRFGDGYLLVINDAGFLAESGFAFVPGQPNEFTLDGVRCSRLWGDWYEARIPF